MYNLQLYFLSLCKADGLVAVFPAELTAQTNKQAQLYYVCICIHPNQKANRTRWADEIQWDDSFRKVVTQKRIQSRPEFQPVQSRWGPPAQGSHLLRVIPRKAELLVGGGWNSLYPINVSIQVTLKRKNESNHVQLSSTTMGFIYLPFGSSKHLWQCDTTGSKQAKNGQSQQMNLNLI